MKNSLKKHGVVRSGHFELTSGRHSAEYINKDSIFCNPGLFVKTYYTIARGIRPHFKEVNIITGPAIAGALLAMPVCLLFPDLKFVYPEKTFIEETPAMIFRRGYDKIIMAFPFVWIVEDIITTGSSVDKTIKAVEGCGGTVVGVSCIWNRGHYEPPVGYFFPLISERVASYIPEQCPMCKDGIPLEDSKG